MGSLSNAKANGHWCVTTVIKYIYRIAGIYGLIVMVPMYFTEERTGLEFPPPITHPEYFYGFIGVTIAWQIAFLVISIDPGSLQVTDDSLDR